MAKSTEKIELSEVVQEIAVLLVRYYLTYYKEHEGLTPIEELKGNFEQIRDNKDYHKAIVVSLMLQILKESKSRDEWAEMILQAYAASIEAGFSEYESIDNLLEQFDLRFDEKNVPFIDIKVKA